MFKAVVIAAAVRGDGHRKIFGVDIGDSENEMFWTECLRDLTDRGLTGVQLVISRAQRGLTATTWRVLHDSAWQLRRVDAMREPLPPLGTSTVTLAVFTRTVDARPSTTGHAPSSMTSSASSNRSHPTTRRLPGMADDLLAYTAFPAVH